MGIIYGFGSVAGEVRTMLAGSINTNSTERIKSLKMFADTSNDIGDATTVGSLYAVAITEKDDKFHGRSSLFAVTGSEFAHFQVELASAFDSKYGVSEIALVAVGSIENGSLLSLEAIGVSTGEPGNSSAITANSVNVEDAMGSMTGSISDNTKLTTIDWSTLGSTESGADVSEVMNVYAIAFTTTRP